MSLSPLKSECICLCGGVIENRCTRNLLIQTRVILGVLSPGSKTTTNNNNVTFIARLSLIVCRAIKRFVLKPHNSLSPSFSLTVTGDNIPKKIILMEELLP